MKNSCKGKTFFMLFCLALKIAFSLSQIIPPNNIEMTAMSDESSSNQLYSSLLEAGPNQVVLSFVVSNKLNFSLINVSTKSFSRIQSSDLQQTKYEFIPSIFQSENYRSKIIYFIVFRVANE